MKNFGTALAAVLESSPYVLLFGAAVDQAEWMMALVVLPMLWLVPRSVWGREEV